MAYHAFVCNLSQQLCNQLNSWIIMAVAYGTYIADETIACHIYTK